MAVAEEGPEEEWGGEVARGKELLLGAVVCVGKKAGLQARRRRTGRAVHGLPMFLGLLSARRACAR